MKRCPRCATGRTSSWMRAFASRTITATRAPSTTRTTWRAAIFIGPPPARPARYAFCPAIAARPFAKFAMDLRATALDRIARMYQGRRCLPDRHGAGHPARAKLPTAARVDRGLPQHRHVSHAGHFGHARRDSGGVLPVPSAHLLRAPEPARLVPHRRASRGSTRSSPDGARLACAPPPV